MKSSKNRLLRFAAALVALAGLVVLMWLVWQRLSPLAPIRQGLLDIERAHAEREATQSALDLSSDEPVDRQAAENEPPSATPAAPEPIAAEPIAPAGQRILLRIVHGQTGAPVPSFRLGVYQKNVEPFEWTSDANGRIETDARYRVGIVNLRHAPLRTEPDLGISWSIAPEHVAVPSQDPSKELIENEVHATPPKLIVEVDVYLPDGRPAADAYVTGSIALSADPLAGGDPAKVVDGWYAEQDTDTSGRARLSVFCDPLDRCAMRVGASLDPNLVSDSLVLDPPLGTGPWRLDLYVSGRIRARVVDEGRRPIVGAFVGLNNCGLTVFKSAYRTDEEGLATTLEMARAGCYEIVATDPRSQRSISHEIELAPGEDRIVDFVFEKTSNELAVRGVVLDEKDEPLPRVAVWVQVDASPPVRVTTNADGSFECWSASGEKVVVRIGIGAWDDRYEPAVSDVPFGATNVAVRRVHSIERVDIPVRIVDRAAPTEALKVSISVFDQGFPEAATTYFATGGLARLSMHPHENTAIGLYCVGYKQREFLLKEIWPDPAGKSPIVIELERGFDRHITVVDANDGKPIVGARFVHPTGRTSVTDARGYVHLTETEWPDVYRIEHDGHASVQWNPNEWTTWTGVVRMASTPK